ncbi:glycine betaine/L-proline ABC transporter ATP-binding protein [uncultured Oscillibacter sp.]|uniref:quaternary amine ABC transporter ATP-binding protein n=3 Tax=Oscillibacter TaxID=459786 RepID=UPI0025EF7772|nr:glycine betaine/L-proline ABC transporter ATP-binding protein [uncultured Oscillibacter sp.]
MSDIIIETKNLSKLYGTRREEAMELLGQGMEKAEVLKKTGVTTALYDINLQIPRGKIFVVIGLSGSGKSTLVRCFNRLHRPTSGSVTFDGVDLLKLNKQELREFRRRKMAMVFQSFGLMSHRNVVGNVAYGLEVSGMGREEREKRAREAIALVGLAGWEESMIGSLSGGMRQRVGLARALANDPEVLLMDEPFSALDPLVRNDMQFELLSIQRKLGKTVIFITHDIDEAFHLGDTVAIMRDGRLIQVDTPEGMSTRPADDYVRRFIDSADKSKVLSVRNIMITPVSLIKPGDGIDHALRLMRKNAISSVYVVDGQMKLQGILTLADAMRAKRENLDLTEMIIKDVPSAGLDASVEEIMPLSAESPYPLAVLDEGGRLQGIVTKASVLSSLV